MAGVAAKCTQPAMAGQCTSGDSSAALRLLQPSQAGPAGSGAGSRPAQGLRQTNRAQIRSGRPRMAAPGQAERRGHQSHPEPAPQHWPWQPLPAPRQGLRCGRIKAGPLDGLVGPHLAAWERKSRYWERCEEGLPVGQCPSEKSLRGLDLECFACCALQAQSLCAQLSPLCIAGTLRY